MRVKPRLRAGQRGARGAKRAIGTFLSLTFAFVVMTSSTAFATTVPQNPLAISVAVSGVSLPPAGSVLSVKARISSAYPIGTAKSSEPSGEAPPSPSALPGYRQSYVTDFGGSTLPDGWSTFTGTPGSDPGSQWASSHVVVSGGLLQLNAWQDPAYGSEWVTGGLCQCAVAQTYGAYFVRSRMTGPGPTQVELLWPVSGWPPEIDFSETYGGDSSSMATLHFSSANGEVHQMLNIDMTKWHTWGVIWTPTLISYVVDGKVWGTVNVAADIPDQPMTLDLQQQTWCSSGQACPTSSQSSQIDWVAEYEPSTSGLVTVGPFSGNSVGLSRSLKSQVARLARTIISNGDSRVTLVGYSNRSVVLDFGLSESRSRALAVAAFLRRDLRAFHDSNVIIKATGRVSSSALVPLVSPSIQALSRVVSASIS